MKRNRYLVPAGLLLFLALCLVPVGQAQQQGAPVNQTPGQPWQLGLQWTFTSADTSSLPFSVKGMSYYRVMYVPSGTVSACSLSLDSSALGTSFSVGGIVTSGSIGACTSANMFVSTAAAVPTIYGRITPTITGSGSVTVLLFGYTENPATSSGASANVNITNASLPVTQSGTWNVGQTGSWNFNQLIGNAGFSKVTDGSNTAAVKAASTAVGATDPSLAVGLSPNSPLPAGTNNLGNVNVQPLGFGSILANQQAVTASAVALASNAVHGVCVKALIGNTINVYVGPAGVTTATGAELAPDESICYQISNTNLLSVIAASTGASVSWTAQ